MKPKDLLHADLSRLIDHAQALVDATAGELDDRIKSARTALKDKLESAKFDTADMQAKVRDKVELADEMVHVKPYHAIGGMFMAGLILGWFMSRK